MSKKNAVSEANEANLTIASAVALSGLSALYIRKAIRSGALVSQLVPVAENSKTLRREFTVEAFEAWRSAAASHTRREDGRNKFVLYMNADEADALRNLIAEGSFTGIVARANVKTEAAIE